MTPAADTRTRPTAARRPSRPLRPARRPAAPVPVTGPRSPAAGHPVHTAVLELQRTAGNRAVALLMEGSSPQVQRLMTLPAFKKKTSIFRAGFSGGRQQVLPVDNALANYNAVTPLTAANVATKQARVNTLIAACTTYLGTTGARKKGVRRLRTDAQYEKQVVDHLAASATAGNATAQFQHISDAQDAQVALRRQGRLAADVTPMDPWMMAAMQALRASPVDMANVLQHEVDQLTDIRDDPLTPPVIVTFLTEVLANVEAGDVEVEAAVGSPMAGYKDRADVTQGYKVAHSLNAPLGSAERLGSLAHELTHVSVSVIFQNTQLFLAFDAGATDREILALSRKRTAQLQELENLMDADPTLDADQKMLLRNKVQYPSKGANGDIKRYLPRFKAELGDARYDALDALADQGLNNTVIEFDTVINQMTLYMHLWQVPLGNPFYARLRAIAQEAADYRGGG